jgi:cytoskeletal protein CcmA (bactofilin family)
MWKKTDQEQTPQQEYTPRASVNQLKERAIIGPSLLIKGDLTGQEDLVVQGRVEGKIELRDHNVTIGPAGRVSADVYAKVISVEGQVQGNLYGDEKIVVRKAGQVKGNLVAPRVSLEDGANFKGSIDMDSNRLPKKPEVKTPPAEKKAAQGSLSGTSQTTPMGHPSDPKTSRGK